MDFQYADIEYYPMRDQKTSEKIVVSWHRSSGRSSGDATTTVSWIQYANHNHPLQPLENAQMPEKMVEFHGDSQFSEDNHLSIMLTSMFNPTPRKLNDLNLLFLLISGTKDTRTRIFPMNQVMGI